VRRLAVDATMEALAPGRAELTLMRGEHEVDRFEVVVAAPGSIEVSAESMLKKTPDAVLTGVHVEEDDVHLNFFSQVVDADGRELFYPDPLATWSVDDPSVLELMAVRHPFYHEPLASVRALAPGAVVHRIGASEVSVAAHGLEARFLVTVEGVPTPPEEGASENGESQGAPEDGESSTDD
jgi:hypothetical protein